MSYYRDTAVALAQRAPGNFIGVWLSVPIGQLPSQWHAIAMRTREELKDWYEEIAGSPSLYYYLAAFDKTQSALPVGETIAPPKPGDPAWAVFWTMQQRGYRWRPNPFGAPAPTTTSATPGVGAEQTAAPTWASEVTPGLFVGSAPPHGPHDVDVIVLAAEEYQPHASRFPGVEVIHAPFDDAPWRSMRPNEIETAAHAAQIVASRLRAGRRVLVSCAMGLNRSGLITALAMHDVYGMSADEIISRLRRARGRWALSNPNFEKLLRAVIDAKRSVAQSVAS